MGRFVAGQVVASVFPFSDLKSHKRRPAVITAVVDHDDLILCQITSKPYASTRAITLKKSDFKAGQLPINSYIRPDKLFTTDTSIISEIHGTLSDNKLRQLKQVLCHLF